MRGRAASIVGRRQQSDCEDACHTWANSKGRWTMRRGARSAGISPGRTRYAKEIADANVRQNATPSTEVAPLRRTLQPRAGRPCARLRAFGPLGCGGIGPICGAACRAGTLACLGRLTRRSHRRHASMLLEAFGDHARQPEAPPSAIDSASISWPHSMADEEASSPPVPTSLLRRRRRWTSIIRPMSRAFELFWRRSLLFVSFGGGFGDRAYSVHR